MCWSRTGGVVINGCTQGTQCGPWLPSGGTWDGSSAWYCLSYPKLSSGASCDYTNYVSKTMNYEFSSYLYLERSLCLWPQLLQWCLHFWNVHNICSNICTYNSANNHGSNNNSIDNHSSYNYSSLCIRGKRSLWRYVLSWYVLQCKSIKLFRASLVFENKLNFWFVSLSHTTELEHINFPPDDSNAASPPTPAAWSLAPAGPACARDQTSPPGQLAGQTPL